MFMYELEITISFCLTSTEKAGRKILAVLKMYTDVPFLCALFQCIYKIDHTCIFLATEGGIYSANIQLSVWGQTRGDWDNIFFLYIKHGLVLFSVSRVTGRKEWPIGPSPILSCSHPLLEEWLQVNWVGVEAEEMLKWKESPPPPPPCLFSIGNRGYAWRLHFQLLTCTYWTGGSPIIHEMSTVLDNFIEFIFECNNLSPFQMFWRNRQCAENRWIRSMTGNLTTYSPHVGCESEQGVPR